jgi:4-amino-4-deoxy-L-arabinose transferase-like glycosyltransferase
VRGDRRRDALVAFGVALLARLAVVAWAHGRFPAVEDGHYYDVLARRLAAGQGYTWLWPDGAVTYAAHYPVGYPAMLALAYAIFGASAAAAMTVNALVGAGAAYGAHRIVDGEGVPRWRPLAAGLAVALHPALVPYTAAVMTEGVTAALLVVATAVASRARAAERAWPWLAGLGLARGIATLVRPQSLLLAPVLGALAVPWEATGRARLVRAAAVTALALALVAPWTARNCVRMNRCALVSVNGGWNLLIGVHTRSGSWEAMDVPAECATVWDEAGKDACFERAARRDIAAGPLAWVARVPGKLGVTLNYFGAAPWYLHASDAEVFDDASKVRLAVVETVACRLLLVGALVAMARLTGPRRIGRRLIAGAGVIAAVTVHGWLGYLALAVAASLLGRKALVRIPIVVPATIAVVLTTALVHAVFFGAGRYGLVVAPFVAALAFAGDGSGRAPSSGVAGRATQGFNRATPIPPLASESLANSTRSASPSLSAAPFSCTSAASPPWRASALYWTKRTSGSSSRASFSPASHGSSGPEAMATTFHAPARKVASRTSRVWSAWSTALGFSSSDAAPHGVSSRPPEDRC